MLKLAQSMKKMVKMAEMKYLTESGRTVVTIKDDGNDQYQELVPLPNISCLA